MFLVNSTRHFSPNNLFSKHCRAFASTKIELYQVSTQVESETFEMNLSYSSNFVRNAMTS